MLFFDQQRKLLCRLLMCNQLYPLYLELLRKQQSLLMLGLCLK